MIELVYAIVGGLVVLGVQEGLNYYKKQKESSDKQREDQENKIIQPAKHKKYLPEDILEHLTVHLSLEKAKEILGTADRVYVVDFSIYDTEEEYENATVYEYCFLNATLKISTENNIALETITIESVSDQAPHIRFFSNMYEQDEGNILGKAVINDCILEHCVNHFSLRTMRDTHFGIEAYYGRFGNYMNYMYFGSYTSNFEKYEETNDPQFLRGSVIEGFCISNKDVKYAQYINFF